MFWGARLPLVSVATALSVDQKQVIRGYWARKWKNINKSRYVSWADSVDHICRINLVPKKRVKNGVNRIQFCHWRSYTIRHLCAVLQSVVL